MTPSRPGERVELRMSKWGDRPHWTFAGVLLGADEHGTWVGWPAGTLHTRPGAEFVAPVDAVTLVPDDPDEWWLATCYAPGFRVLTYVDVATPVVWERGADGEVAVGRSVDLDLDVVRLPDGSTYVDDEDEFAEHQVAFGYPADVVARAERACAAVLEQVRAGAPSFDDETPRGWLERLTAHTRRGR